MIKAPQSGRHFYKLYRALWQSLDWLYPPRCGGCDRLGERWCANCAEHTKTIQGSMCPRCGDPNQDGTLCMDCEQHPPAYQYLRSWAVFNGPLREAIHNLKYRGDMGLGEALSRPLITCIDELGWQFDLVIPVPLSRERYKQRGFNQSALLARPVALYMGCTYRSKVLLRMRDTPSQVGLNEVQRKANVADAFKALPGLVKDLRVLVIDDVTTTGATIQACSAALMTAGAKKVLGLTLARAV